MQKDEKITLASIERLCFLLCVIMAATYCGLSLSTTAYKNLSNKTIALNNDSNRMTIVNFRCQIPLGTDTITDTQKCTVIHQTSKHHEIATKIANLESSKKRTLNCGIFLLISSIICATARHLRTFLTRRNDPNPCKRQANKL